MRGGRVDVIDAIRKHDVGYHTDWHSRHPMVSEYLVDAGWDDGVELVLRNEGPGLDDVRRVFEGGVVVRPGRSGMGAPTLRRMPRMGNPGLPRRK